MSIEQPSRIAMITGANSGIGLELTLQLLAKGWQVVTLNRSDFPLGSSAIQKAIASGRLRNYKVRDLTDYTSLHEALGEIKSKEQHIDVLFNNAGGSFDDLESSKQGRELHYELMAVVPYIIVMEMMSLLKTGHIKTVINTSSSVIVIPSEVSIATLEHPTKFRKLFGPYASSKLALTLWTYAVAPQLAKDQINIRSVDPGGNNTLKKGKKSGLPLPIEWLQRFVFPKPTHGAKQLYEGAFETHLNESGVFISKGKISKIKFIDQAPELLERMHTLYTNEFLPLKKRV
ncbi:SDR family NAD(P)-dependent oxidoreductase [Aureibacillus halotolerans]|uniref:NAD(P)-dependent dehydrogenase (Short-subunit alcohol dehydrogenase family) n=1 Tax=Aureibacillus halotolerans TaxID=1508390 RepID=A0A4R6U2S0_9BACI|nr:SDR family NAD(P)-dependent oxidoreductase [Aureibacillus halotolerans]TDQ38739.1 NAD(P)-dependent dehydrogenase (short-subunit alcohol dehydrogenase family) [Aureibacillus halotolerans]